MTKVVFAIAALFGLGGIAQAGTLPTSTQHESGSTLVARCTDDARALKAAGWTDIPTDVAIAAAESSCDNSAVEHDSNGTIDECFMQVNSSHHAPDLGTLDGCAKAAKKIRDSQGLKAWSSVDSGSYRKYLPLGRQVAKAIA